MARHDETLLGQLAVHYGLISAEQLAECLETQEKTEPPAYLGDIMVRARLVGDAALQRLLGVQKRQKEGDTEVRRKSVFFSRKDILDRSAQGEIRDLLALLVELGGSDLHLSSGSRARIRLFGSLVGVGSQVLGDEQCRAHQAVLLTEEQRSRLEKEQSVVGLYTCAPSASSPASRFRVSAFAHDRGTATVIRHIPASLPPIEELHLPPIIDRVAKLARGLVLVTGPRGSGKTTTLATMLELLNSSRHAHIVTLERPIEYVVDSRTCQVSQREVEAGPDGFPRALRSALRENPDVIVIGELGDADQIMTALTAAETGHLVLGTLHTTNASRTILRIVDAYQGRRRNLVRSMLASVLRLVLSQCLIPGRDHDRQWLATEVLVVTAAVSNMIREDRIHRIPQIMQTGGRESGMRLMDDALAALVAEGKVDVEDAVARAEEPYKILRYEVSHGRP